MCETNMLKNFPLQRNRSQKTIVNSKVKHSNHLFRMKKKYFLSSNCIFFSNSCMKLDAKYSKTITERITRKWGYFPFSDCRCSTVYFNETQKTIFYYYSTMSFPTIIMRAVRIRVLNWYKHNTLDRIDYHWSIPHSRSGKGEIMDANWEIESDEEKERERKRKLVAESRTGDREDRS